MNLTLFDEPFPEPLGRRKKFEIKLPLRTRDKAKLVSEYIYLFSQVTKHGFYIDGFAGPQSPASRDSWAAKLVLHRKPFWLKDYFLSDIKESQIRLIDQMLQQAPSTQNGRALSRRIEVRQGDFNFLVSSLVRQPRLRGASAVFCLLDQRTFECKWETLSALARCKKKGQYKPEIFYFLAAAWFQRAYKNQTDKSKIRDWWGRQDWENLGEIKPHELATKICTRLKTELLYGEATPWPIFEEGRIMYYMLHATDHGQAPALMQRAYRRSTGKDLYTQSSLPW